MGDSAVRWGKFGGVRGVGGGRRRVGLGAVEREWCGEEWGGVQGGWRGV